MKSQSQFKLIEHFIYGIFLLIILLGPTISTLFHGHSIDETEFLLNDIKHTFKLIVGYLIVCAIHDIFIAPLLVYKHKNWQYCLGVLILGVAFMTYNCSRRPIEPKVPISENIKPANDFPNTSPGLKNFEPTNKAAPHAQRPMNQDIPTPTPPPFSRGDILSVIIFLFSIGTNIGVKLHFSSVVAKREMEELEKENLKQNLKYLKYQLHPHFFMNTLNNIHALVDINPEKAQECIVDLSKLMRYILYDSNHEYVQASREVKFMENYVRLMKLRYNDKLKFTTYNTDDGKGIWIPPLVFISFVENAFKHGVSYNTESFIEVRAQNYTSSSGELRLNYSCRNSKPPKSNNSTKTVSEDSGVGLANIKRRLDLMFGDNYSLNITNGDSEFIVNMDIPVHSCDPNSLNDKNKNNNK